MSDTKARKKILITVAAIILTAAIVCAIILPLVLKSEGEPMPEIESTMPVVEITTQGGAIPVNKTDYVNSSFKLTADDEEHNFEVSMKDSFESSNSVGIRLRGNSTMLYPKKPFRIKFDKKQSMFGSAANKNWVLLADYLDPSLIKNYSALKLSQIFDNMPWNSFGTHVNLYMNGEYYGIYLLCDQIDEKSGRLDLEDENAYTAGQAEYPFLVEISEDHERDMSVDRADIFSVKSFVTTEYYPDGSPAEIKYPEAGDGRPDDATEYITGYVNEVFDALWAGDINKFESLADIDSFVDYVLLNELCSNSDAIWKSIYICKKNGEKLKFGPVWDFDGGFGVWTGSPDDTEQNYANAFSTFYSTYCRFVKKYFEAAGSDGYDKFAARLQGLNAKIDAFYLDLVSYKEVIKSDGIENQNIWYGEEGGLFEKNYNANLLFFINHITYLRNLYTGGYEEFMQKVYIDAG